MARADQLTTGKLVKMFYVGHSGTGKTGSLLSLIEAGYNIKLMDFDNGFQILINLIQHQCPERLGQLDVESFRDIWTMGPTGPAVKGSPRAFTSATKMLDKWSDGTSPAEWGPDTIFVLDSVTHYGRAAYNFAVSLNPQYKDQKLHYHAAQQLIFNQLATIMSDYFKCHVILISHIDVREQEDKTEKHFVSAIGKALGPKLPSICNTLVLAESSGIGANAKRKIKTLPTGLLDLKNPAPFRVEASYPLETGLATLFKDLLGETKPNA